jgi:hypothetical protein
VPREALIILPRRNRCFVLSTRVGVGYAYISLNPLRLVCDLKLGEGLNLCCNVVELGPAADEESEPVGSAQQSFLGRRLLLGFSAPQGFANHFLAQTFDSSLATGKKS